MNTKHLFYFFFLVVFFLNLLIITSSFIMQLEAEKEDVIISRPSNVCTQMIS